MAETPNVTVKVGIESINMNREQAARAEAVMIAAEVLRYKEPGKAFSVAGSSPALAVDIMSLAEYIVSGCVDEDAGPYEFVFTRDDVSAGEPSVPEDGSPDHEHCEDD